MDTMQNAKHWMACLDLSNMDDILIGYSSFLSTVVNPETITFFHVIESGPTALELVDQFPEIETKEEFLRLIREDLNDKVKQHFKGDEIEVRVVIKEGKPTDQIIDVVNSLEPDLLIMGKKIGYAGEGVIPMKILDYVPCSVLFVPENSRYNLNKILVPVDFSDQSAAAINTASSLTKSSHVTAQHIYQYRAQFFPYSLSEKEKKEVDRKIESNKETFQAESDIPEDIHFVLSLHKKGKIADEVYNQAVRDQTDLIVVASKSKRIGALIRHDFTDKMVEYAFGIPLLILKNRERHMKFLKSLFS
jgi:nucleotide-binding universal stress UspA family protein